MTRTLLPLVALLSVDAGPSDIGILSALSVAPGFLIGLLIGGRVDRSAKRPMLIGSDLVRAGLLITVPAAAWIDWLSMWHLYFVAAGVGAATSVFQIADNAYLPSLIGKKHLVEANAKLEVTEAIAEIGGPSLAGAMLLVVTAPVAIVFDTVSYVISAAFLGLIRKPEVGPDSDTESPTLMRDLRVGLRAGFEDAIVRPLFLASGCSAFFNSFFFTLYMIFTIETLGLSPGVVGVLIGLGGVGALFGTVIAQWLPSRLGLGGAMILLAGFGQATVLLIPMASGPSWVAIGLLGVHQFFGDALLTAYFVLAISLRQTVLPMNVLGRANATFHMMTGVLVPSGALIAGWLATATDVRSTVWIAAIGGLLVPFILLFSRIRGLRRMP